MLGTVGKASANGAEHSWQIARSHLALPDAVWQQPKAVVTVNAPMGYGKSTLLSQWQEQCVQHGYWVVSLSASSSDHNGDKLLIDLTEALGREVPESSESVLDSYGSEGKRALVKALLAELGASEPGAAVFLDDIHELVGYPAEAMLRLLLRHQPDGVMLVFSGRSNPSAGVSQALLEGRLQRFDGDRLAFTDDEIKELLRQHHILPREELVERLRERTQGWPAAVRLVALTLEENQEWQDAFVSGLSENPRALTDYLNETLLSQLPPRLYRFLLRLSLLPSFTLPLAVTVTAMDDAALMLEDLERRALPLFRSGNIESTYSLHPLVRDFLLARLRHEGGAVLADSRERAATWLISHGRIDAAIDVYLNAGEIDRAAALINEHALIMVQQYGRHTTYLYWINKLPPEALAKFPEIRLRQAWALDFVHRHEDAEAIRHQLEMEILHSGGIDGGRILRDELEKAIELQRCVQAGLRDEALISRSRTQTWLSRWPEGSAFDHATAHTVMAFCEKALSDFDSGLQHARKAQRLGRESHCYYMLAWTHMLVIANLAKQGHYRQALHECDEYLAELAPCLGERAPAVMMLYAMQAGLLYEFNRLPDVSAALGRGLTALIEQSSTDPIIMGYVTLARLQNQEGDHLTALETLAEGENLGRIRGLPRLTVALAAERIVLLLRHGELNQAQRLWEELEDTPSGDASAASFANTLADKASRIQGRIALLNGNHADVCELVAPTLQHARRTGQKKKQVEVLLLQTLALHQGGHIREALALLREALDLATPEGYIRTFCDEGVPMRELLETYFNETDVADLSAPTVSFLDQLATVIGLRQPDAAAAAPDTESEQGGIAEPLTSREVQILAKLRAGPSNRQLADTLFITESTLKWHLRNIYGKLGVTNRLAAVAKGRQLGLLNH